METKAITEAVVNIRQMGYLNEKTAFTPLIFRVDGFIFMYIAAKADPIALPMIRIRGGHT
jgi:hypothetical protein